jgi:hypothetical protein
MQVIHTTPTRCTNWCEHCGRAIIKCDRDWKLQYPRFPRLLPDGLYRCAHVPRFAEPFKTHG